MTIKECIKTQGWQSEIQGNFKRYQSVDINFKNNGKDDETQFDITGAGTKQGEKELTKLFADFCKENNILANTVTNISIIAVADTYKELTS